MHDSTERIWNTVSTALLLACATLDVHFIWLNVLSKKNTHLVVAEAPASGIVYALLLPILHT